MDRAFPGYHLGTVVVTPVGVLAILQFIAASIMLTVTGSPAKGSQTDCLLAKRWRHLITERSWVQIDLENSK
jgi:hypothetical protein